MSEKLYKKFDISSIELKEEGGDFFVTGYASVFGVKDTYGDIVRRGAFVSAIENYSRIKLLYQHDLDKPIGKFVELREDDKGLFFKAKISKTTLGKDAIIMLQDGVLEEFSFGYYTKKSVWDEENETRELLEVELIEISLVTRAANEHAKVMSTEGKADLGKLSDDDLLVLKKSIDTEIDNRILKRL